MHSKQRGIWSVALAVALASLSLSGIAARAQNNEAGTAEINNKKVTLNLENADIRYALKLLFQSVGANYTLDQNVQGNVTVSLTDVSFRTALESILRGTGSSSPLTYRVENGVYNVAPKVVDTTTLEPSTTDTNTEPTTKPSRTVKIQVNYADAIDISSALGGGVIQTRFSQLGGGGGGGFGGGRGQRERAPRELHDAICATCGKPTQVPFKPSGDRPVYCRDCFRR